MTAITSLIQPLKHSLYRCPHSALMLAGLFQAPMTSKAARQLPFVQLSYAAPLVEGHSTSVPDYCSQWTVACRIQDGPHHSKVYGLFSQTCSKSVLDMVGWSREIEHGICSSISATCNNRNRRRRQDSPSTITAKYLQSRRYDYAT